MPAISTIVLAGVALASAGSSAYGAKRDRDRAERAQDSADDQAAAEQQMAAQLESKESAERDRDARRRRQRALQAERAGMAGTTMTSPLGLPGVALTGYKTALGL